AESTVFELEMHAERLRRLQRDLLEPLELPARHRYAARRGRDVQLNDLRTRARPGIGDGHRGSLRRHLEVGVREGRIGEAVAERVAHGQVDALVVPVSDE